MEREKKMKAVSLVMLHILKWDGREDLTEAEETERTKRIYRDLITKQRKVSPAATQAMEIYQSMQGRELTLPSYRVFVMDKYFRRDFAQQRALQAELCN